jgi:protease stability complex PrcB-like protein
MLLHFVASSWLFVNGMNAIGMQSGASLRILDKGAQSNIDSPRQVVARTAAEWTALWKQHDSDKPAPAVDFSREMVLAVFMGSRPTAGYSVEITSVDARDGGIVVSYHETAPPRDAITAQILTSPYYMVAVSGHKGEVRFEKK